MRKLRSILLLAGAATLIAACGKAASGEADPVAGGSSATTTAASTSTDDSEASGATGTIPAAAANAAYHEEATDYTWDESSVVEIELLGGTVTAGGSGVSTDGNIATITAPGTYRLSGTLDPGQIVVDSGGDGVIRLLLAGVDITSDTGAALSVVDAGKVVIILESDSNYLADAASYTAINENGEPNAALFSNADLTIAGDGSIAVTGNFNDGITSKDGLVVAAGTITVAAVDDGIRGKDYIVVEGGSIAVTAGGDAIKADNEDDASLGYISIVEGSFALVAGGEGIDAASDITIAAGDFSISTGGGADASISDTSSAKGLKAEVSVVISGGTLSIDSADDGVHANDSISITGGTFAIASGDDGMHADTALSLTGATIDITQSYEGLESAVITIDSGSISIVANDDGINVAGGDGSGEQGAMGGGGPDQFAASGDYWLYLNGGTVVIYADGDGIDSNGAIVMTDGIVVVQGPTANMNGALDYVSFELSGGTIVAVGSSGMAQAPNSSSNQPTISFTLNSTVAGGTLVHLESADGDDVLTFAPAKSFQSVVFSSPDLIAGAGYEVYLEGTAAGDEIGGLYSSAVYGDGTSVGSVTASG